MKVEADFSHDSTWGIVGYIQPSLDALSTEDSSSVLMNGIGWLLEPSIRQKYEDYERRCLLALWSPCEFLGQVGNFYFDSFSFFTEVYCVCPFTCKFMNEYFNEEKFKYIPYPFTNYSLEEIGDYDTTCCWFGGIHGQDHINAIETISQRSYKFITSGQNRLLHHDFYNTKVTHFGLSTAEKLIEVSRCKSSLTFNKLYLNPSSAFNSTQGNLRHEAFSDFDLKIMPQFKVRTHEIATCKSLILAYKDVWNLIDDFYTEGEEFIYFEDFKHLEDILEDVENNFDNYQNIINNAYEKVKGYSVENIFEYIKKDNPNLITWSLKNVQ